MRVLSSHLSGITERLAKSLAILGIVAITLLAFGATDVRLATSLAQATQYLSVTLDPNDTIAGIAAVYGVTVEDLYRINGVSSPGFATGAAMLVPLSQRPESAQILGVAHAVRWKPGLNIPAYYRSGAGELFGPPQTQNATDIATWYAIVQRAHGGSILELLSEVLALNGLGSPTEALPVGKVLVIPGVSVVGRAGLASVVWRKSERGAQSGLYLPPVDGDCSEYINLVNSTIVGWSVPPGTPIRTPVDGRMDQELRFPDSVVGRYILLADGSIMGVYISTIGDGAFTVNLGAEVARGQVIGRTGKETFKLYPLEGVLVDHMESTLRSIGLYCSSFGQPLTRDNSN